MDYVKNASFPTDLSTNLTVESRVREIVKNIKENKVDALKRYNREIDNYTGPIFVSNKRIETCKKSIPSDLRDAICKSMKNLRDFHKKQRDLFVNFEDISPEGIYRGIRFLPVSTAGCYIPGGRYPLPSSVLMNVIPAQEAGVKRIIISSPPSFREGIHPVIIATAALAGISEIVVAGGAQAIAAMAFGVGNIPKCDIVTGPGNCYVTEAKRQLNGRVGIDGLAGPSEVLIIADTSASPENLAMDLMAQAEHDPMSRALLFTTDRKIAEKTIFKVKEIISKAPTGRIMSRAWTDNGEVLIGTLDEAVDYANKTGPEHLQLCIEDPRSLLGELTSYGTVFIGNNTSVPYGDYIAGTNHILPTSGNARFSGGLWTGTFLRSLTHLELSGKGIKNLSIPGIRIAEVEGLWAHGESMKLRYYGKDFTNNE